jgi:DNA modification methylase
VTATYHVGDVRQVLATFDDDTFDLAFTSPPFLALRSYLPADHPDKALEIGSEATPGEYLQTLLDLTQEWGRVLTRHGTLVVELGDTYAGSGGGGGDYLPDGLRENQPGFGGSAERQREGNAAHWRQKNREPAGWPLDKSLSLIPTLYPASLAYGRNLLTGQPCDRWRIRNLIVWHRPNPPVGALGDKVRPSTSYLTVACKARDRWFDLDAVRGPMNDHSLRYWENGSKARDGFTDRKDAYERDGSNPPNPAGAPPLDAWFDQWDPTNPHDVWTIPTQPYKGAHYATFPYSLAKRVIEMCCPRRVCQTCGEPRRRITERNGNLDPTRPQARRAMQLAEEGGLTEEHFAAIRAFGIHDAGKAQVTQTGAGKNSAEVKRLAGEAKTVLGGYFREYLIERPATSGWTDCGCSDDGSHWRPGHILDPFAGSGTTLEAAVALGYTAVGIDLDPRNLDLARQRVGMFLEVAS